MINQDFLKVFEIKNLYWIFKKSWLIIAVAKNHKQLCDLNRVQLCKLLANDKLLVTSEATVYKAVLQWVQSNPAERSQYWEDLLDHVHFTLMSKDEVENCLQNSVVKKNLNLVNKLKAAMDYLEKPTDEKIDYW